MSLPQLQWSHLLTWPEVERRAPELQRRFEGQSISMPRVLSDEEHEAVADALFALLRWPVQGAGSRQEPSGPVIVLGGDNDLDPPTSARRVRVQLDPSGPVAMPGLALQMPRALYELRDVFVDCVASSANMASIRDVVALSLHVADSPYTAMKFVDGVLSARENPSGEAGFVAGAASVLSALLRGVDSEVAQWVLALALDPVAPERMLPRSVLDGGRARAVKRAYECGLVELLPADLEHGEVVFRRGIRILRNLQDLPLRVSLPQVRAALTERLSPSLLAVLDYVARPPRAPLGLGGPALKGELIGRDEEIARLGALLAPGDTVRVVVLHGPEGSGRIATAATLSKRISGQREAVWLDFAQGGACAWRAVAKALGLPIPDAADEQPSPPAWLHGVFDYVRAESLLFVLHGIDLVAEADLPAWIPQGSGRCAVLVLSSRPERPTQQRHDAVDLWLRPLSPDSARALLASRCESSASAVSAGETDTLLEALGYSPGAIVLAAALLGRWSVAELLARVEASADPPLVAMEAAQVEALSAPERAVVELLTAMYPGVLPVGLVREMAGSTDGGPLLSLFDRGVVDWTNAGLSIRGLARRAVMVGVAAVRVAELRGHCARVVLRGVVFAMSAGDRFKARELLPCAHLLKREICELGELEEAILPYVLTVAVHLVSFAEQGAISHAELALEMLSGVLRNVQLVVGSPNWVAAQGTIGTALLCLLKNGDHTKFEMAVEAHRLALNYTDRQISPDQWLKLQMNLGNVWQAVGTVESQHEALRTYQAVLDVARTHGDSSLLCVVLANVGVVLKSIGVVEGVEHLHQAAETLAEAEALAQVSGQLRLRGLVLVNLGAVLLDLERHGVKGLRSALDVSAIGLALVSNEEHPIDWARASLNLGQALLNLPEVDLGHSGRCATETFAAGLRVINAHENTELWVSLAGGLVDSLLLASGGDLGNRIDTVRQICEFILQLPSVGAEAKARAQLRLGRVLIDLTAEQDLLVFHRALAMLNEAAGFFAARRAISEWAEGRLIGALALYRLAQSEGQHLLRDAVSVCNEVLRQTDLDRGHLADAYATAARVWALRVKGGVQDAWLNMLSQWRLALNQLDEAMSAERWCNLNGTMLNLWPGPAPIAPDVQAALAALIETWERQRSVGPPTVSNYVDINLHNLFFAVRGPDRPTRLAQALTLLQGHMQLWQSDPQAHRMALERIAIIQSELAANPPATQSETPPEDAPPRPPQR